MLPLDRALATLRGIGPKRAAELAGLGYETFEDLLYHLPFRYEDRRLRLPLSRLAEGDRVSFLATVRAPRTIWTRRRGFNIFQATLDDGTARLPAVWYNQPYLARPLTEGREAWFFGELRRARTGTRALRFENPQYETVDPEPESVPRHTARIVPIYERLGSLSSKSVRSLVHGILEGGEGVAGDAATGDAATGDAATGDAATGDAATGDAATGDVDQDRDRAGDVDRDRGRGRGRGREVQRERGGEIERDRARDPLPGPMRARLGLTSRDEALRLVHFPPDGSSLEALNSFATPHYRRLVFDEENRRIATLGHGRGLGSGFPQVTIPVVPSGSASAADVPASPDGSATYPRSPTKRAFMSHDSRLRSTDAIRDLRHSSLGWSSRLPRMVDCPSAG
jgi:hypothetical protein